MCVCVCVCVMDAERDTRRTALLGECFQQKSRWVCVCVVCVCVYVSWMQNEKLGGLHCWVSDSNKSLGERVCVRVCVCVYNGWRTRHSEDCIVG